jgi:excisionase family DNA binding protein
MIPMNNTTKNHNSVLPDPSAEPVCSVERAGQILGISRSSAYGAVIAGEIPSVRLGRRIVIPTAPLLRMLGVENLIGKVA